jgi:hypothetical protein
MRISTRARFLFLIFAGFSILPLFGDPLTYSTSSSTTTSGSVSFGYSWENCPLSTNVCSDGPAGTYFTGVYFSLLLRLPSSPGATLNDATLALSLPQDQGSVTIAGEGSTAVQPFDNFCEYYNGGDNEEW